MHLFLAGRARALALLLAVCAAFLAVPAHAFDEANAGIYTVFDKKTQKLTDIAYRFYVQDGKWVAEERGADGGWTAFKCEKDCEIASLTDKQAARLFGPNVEGISNRNCIGNNNFAVCSYLAKAKNAPDPVLNFLMFVSTDKGVFAVPLSWTAPI
jgi:hypothetical protein